MMPTCYTNFLNTSGDNHACHIQSNAFYEHFVHWRKPQHIFSLKGSGEVNLKQGQFIQVKTKLSVLSPTTCGVLEIEKDQNWCVSNKSTHAKNFEIAIAVFSNNLWVPKFKLVVMKDAILFLNDNFSLNKNLSFIAIIGLNLSNDTSIEIHTNTESKFLDLSLQYPNMPIRIDSDASVFTNAPNEVPASVHCFNCGNHTHATDQCFWPFYNENHVVHHVSISFQSHLF